jgi:hypothetical protein
MIITRLHVYTDVLLRLEGAAERNRRSMRVMRVKR